MARLIDPVTGTVVNIEGDLEKLYRARGWVDPSGQLKKNKATPEKPVEDDGNDKPVTRRNTRRTK